MNDVKNLLDEALRDEPAPGGLDLDALERAGRRRVRSRRLGIAGAATASIALVTAAALILPGAFTGSDGPTNDNVYGPAEEGEEYEGQPEFPLPELDPDEMYVFLKEGGSLPTPETEELTSVFWEYMSENVPGLTVFPSSNPTGEPVGPDRYPEMMRTVQELWLLTGDWESTTSTAERRETTGYQRPIYGFGDHIGGEALWFADENSIAFNTMGLSVHPKGSFEAEPKSYPDGSPASSAVPHLVGGCEDRVYTVDPKTTSYTFDCSTATGPGGEDVQIVESSMWTGENLDFLSVKTLSVVVTLENGNAVVITNWLHGTKIDAVDHDDLYADITDIDPVLDADQLIDMAVSLPQVRVA